MFVKEGKKQTIIGYIEYDCRLNVAQPGVRSTIQELELYNGAANKQKKCSCKSTPVIQEVYINLETGRTTESKTPPIMWKSEACLNCMSLIGNRMPYNPRAYKTIVLKEDGTHNVERETYANLYSHYQLPTFVGLPNE